MKEAELTPGDREGSRPRPQDKVALLGVEQSLGVSRGPALGWGPKPQARGVGSRVGESKDSACWYFV